MLKKNQLTASPACIPKLELEPLLKTYSELGFKNFEIFTNWVESTFDWTKDPEEYLKLAQRFGIKYTSLHLPKMSREETGSLQNSVKAAVFAEALGAEVVIFKADTVEDYIEYTSEFLDQIQDLSVTPVITNHSGTAITLLEDYIKVMDGVNDERLKALLEVGHFHVNDVEWKAGYEYVKDRLALVHIKDIIGKESVKYGTGEVDLPGLFHTLDQDGYKGQIVVEVEKKPQEIAIEHLKEGLRYFDSYFQ